MAETSTVSEGVPIVSPLLIAVLAFLGGAFGTTVKWLLDRRAGREDRRQAEQAAQRSEARARSATAAEAAMAALHVLRDLDRSLWGGPYEQQRDGIKLRLEELSRVGRVIADEPARDQLEFVVDLYRNLDEVAYRVRMGDAWWTMRLAMEHATETLAAYLRAEPPPDQSWPVTRYAEILEEIRERERRSEEQHTQRHAARSAVDPPSKPYPPPRT